MEAVIQVPIVQLVVLSEVEKVIELTQQQPVEMDNGCATVHLSKRSPKMIVRNTRSTGEEHQDAVVE